MKMRIKFIYFLFLIVVSSCSHFSDAQSNPKLNDEAKGYTGNYQGKVSYEIVDSQEKLTFENIAKAKISNVWLEFRNGFGKANLSTTAIKEINEGYRSYLRFCLNNKLENNISFERDMKITESLDKLDKNLSSEKISSPDGERLLSAKERGRLTDFVIKKALERCND